MNNDGTTKVTMKLHQEKLKVNLDAALLKVGMNNNY